MVGLLGLVLLYLQNTDALGQLLFEYTKRVYTSQLQHLKDIAGTLSMEMAKDPAQILQQMKVDASLLTLEGGGLPIPNPSTAAEDARLASLISLDGILTQVKVITRQGSINSLSKSKKRAMFTSLDELGEQMPSLLEIDHPCAPRQIAEARVIVEVCPLIH
ncbi:kinesin-like protein KIN-14A isoform X2 [Amaranthus tricolor]|uniref:kinesin-like protein KIN-14A isoform X2 n=1 Tax=Amaranthus tricolor TaxID=29722 RepID=UPI0025845540|nr:kinesin-like protein KIN-14A isoform X2 [Amaranthus tricolor]